MNKMITIGLVSALSALLFIGCSASNQSTLRSHDAKTVDSVFFIKHLTLQKAHKLIMVAGERDGWKMTEFKVNAMIAEKIGSEESYTVTFGKDYFDVTPSNSSLTSTIEDAF